MESGNHAQLAAHDLKTKKTRSDWPSFLVIRVHWGSVHAGLQVFVCSYCIMICATLVNTHTHTHAHTHSFWPVLYPID